MQFPTVCFLGTCFIVAALVSRVSLASSEENCSLICAVRGNFVEDGRYQFVERTTKVLYCNDGDKWKTISAKDSDISDAKSKFSCRMSPVPFLEIQSQQENNTLDRNCRLKLQGDITGYFDFLYLTLNQSSTLLLNSTAEKFVSDARCHVRLAAKWFREEVCLSSLYCGSADQRLSHLVSWKIAEMKGTSKNNPGLSCKEIQDKCLFAPNGIYWINPNASSNENSFQVYCKDGWTLIMKIDGRAKTFNYRSTLWTSTAGLATDSVQIDQIEAKLPSYWTLPSTQLLIVMKKFRNVERELTIPLPASFSGMTLHSLIADGQYRQTNVGRAAWKSLVPDSSLQRNCNKEGFNSQRVRLGIIGNQEKGCGTPDSYVGIGGNDITSGNIASFSADNGNKRYATFSYVYGK